MTRGGGGGGAADEEKGVVTTTVVKQSDKGGVVIPNATSSIARFMMVIVCLLEKSADIVQCVDRYFIYHNNLFLSSWKFSSFCGWCVRLWCGYFGAGAL